MNVTIDYRAVSQVRSRELDRAATALLRRKGFTPSGTPRSRRFNPSQYAFERLLVKTPTGGKPGWRR